MSRIRFFSLTLIIVLVSSFLLANPVQIEAATYSSTNLANDTDFININGMSANQIQDFLKSNGSFLKNYSEGGRTAAQIIYDAAHGHGDATGTVGGIAIHETINPVAILAVLQKEQGLVTMSSKNNDALKVAMGFACPDSGGSDEKYRGFTKQVENGAWQLRYNFERAKGNGFKDYQVGQSVKIDGKKIKLSNRSTSALYRYTPHLSLNFSKYFTKWNKYGANASNDGKIFRAVFSKLTISKKVVKPGQTVTVTMTYKNTGTAIWYNSGDTLVKLGTQNPKDGNSLLLNNSNRVNLRVSGVKRTKKGIFVWTFKAPTNPGTYSVTLQPVSGAGNWFGPAKTITIVVK
ncbi:MAG: hypothetical protein WCP93_01255 [Candidatus Berkelbacteria bacterium]